MSCPTCDHTMTPLYVAPADCKVYGCPRCGTIKTEFVGGRTEIDIPKLVGYVRTLLDTGSRDLTGLGVHVATLKECVWLPEERSTKGGAQ